MVRRSKVHVGLTIERYREIEPAVILGLVRLLGLEFVEITKSVFDDLDRVVSKLDGMTCGFHLPIVCEDGWDFATADAQDRIDHLVELINRHAERLRLRYIVTHPPEPNEEGQLPPEAVERLLTNLSRLRTPLYIENIPRLPLAEYRSFYEHARQRLGAKVAGMCYDGPHYLISGINPLEPLASFNGEIGCVHLSDCTATEDVHAPFGKAGAMPVEAVMRTLKESNFAGVINLEIRPDDFQDIFPTIHSYLTVLKWFRPAKYVTARVRVALLYPLMRRILS